MTNASPDDVSVFHYTGNETTLTAWLTNHGWAIIPDARVNDAVFLHRIGGGPDDYTTAAPGQLLAASGTDLSRDTRVVLPRC